MLIPFRLALIVLMVVATGVRAETIIHAGRLIDGRVDRVRTEVTLTIADGKIVSIDSGYRLGKDGDTVVDLKSSTVMPGLMDMHTHLITQHHKRSTRTNSL